MAATPVAAAALSAAVVAATSHVASALSAACGAPGAPSSDERRGRPLLRLRELLLEVPLLRVRCKVRLLRVRPACEAMTRRRKHTSRALC